MQEILVALALIAAFVYTSRLLYKSFRGQASTCGCACQDCPAGNSSSTAKKALPMYQPKGSPQRRF